MTEVGRRLSWAEELALAEEQTPGHRASKGPGDTIVLTPVPEYVDKLRVADMQRRLGQGAELALVLEGSAA